MLERPKAARPRKPYHPTPLGPEYTEDELKKMREEVLPHGVYPGTYGRGQMPVRASYPVPAAKPPESDGEGIKPASPDYAELLIASIPKGLSVPQRRAYWEHSLLDAYYHLYGDHWSQWEALIPWLKRSQIPLKAESYACEMPWDWPAKTHFLNANGFRWNLTDLNRLIDRYPDYQRDNDSQGMYIPGKPFEEIQKVAAALNLPTAKTLELLAEHAQKLD